MPILVGKRDEDLNTACGKGSSLEEVLTWLSR